MARNSRKLKQALDRFQGKDYVKERQRKQQKEAGRRKERKAEPSEYSGEDLSNEGSTDDENDADNIQGILTALARHRGAGKSESVDFERELIKGDTNTLVDDLDESDSESFEDAEDFNNAAESNPNLLNVEQLEEDIALSDLSDVEAADDDIVPHQRLTINNTTALRHSLSTFALHTQSMPFSEHQSLTTSAPVIIDDVENDLSRELAFYAQCMAAVKEARNRLGKEGTAFSRPADYFAEMVKSDEHMGKIKAKLVDEAASKKASADAKHQRDLKKFGKQVQNEKLKERAQAKREMLEKVNLLKRKRQGADIMKANEEDMFDVALEDAAITSKKDRELRRNSHSAKTNRQQRDSKYGFGGKKRHAKSGDAASSADMSEYSVAKMKGPSRSSARRPGKNKRARQR